ncbi:hypothetical protein D2U09_13990 [Lactiplantibacillus plantarum]|uniref:rhamnosyltransferase WsaF family glycosyltransferase n=1 Tax=Lactiplantibacillus plantarum TaxID=1590 RepID=UPI000E59EEF0|nr:hypothetical protein [Lactiplantibacillus plantarum]RHX73033.1 hypothetical protein D2U09_13990 [Lactiplantibacillus plantarum]
MNKVSRIAYRKVNKYDVIDFDYLSPIKFSQSENTSERPRLNLILPKLNKKYVFGGISTALKMFNTLASDMKMDKRIIITDVPLNKELESEYPDFSFNDTDKDMISEKSVSVCAADPLWRKNSKLPIKSNDIFIATSWRTKFVFEDLIKAQTKFFNKHNDMIYLIQDYEPGFFNWSSESMLVDSTYKTKDTVAVFNSTQLKDYFTLNRYEFDAQIAFDPVLNESMKTTLSQESKRDSGNRQNIILLYGRPFTDRNCFSLAVASLNNFIERYSPDKSWKFISVGTKHRNIELSNGFKLSSLGKLSLDNYAKILLNSRVGLSLMSSPHPSYPPLEMSTAGMQTVTNTFICKNLDNFNQNIISVERTTFNNIADALQVAVTRSESAKRDNLVDNSAYFLGDSQFDKVTTFIKDWFKL